MDERAKEKFKWKFWHVAMMLNLVILFYALVIIFLFIIPDPYKIPGSLLFLIAGVVMTFTTRKKYLETKQWLSDNADEKIVIISDLQ
jgi:exopolysaccharide biosynthesis protein